MTSTTPAELLHLHPTDVEIEENVTSGPAAEPGLPRFYRGARSVGPRTGRADEGRGNPYARRTATYPAARQVGLQQYRCMCALSITDTTAARAQRVIEQMVTNDHRAPLTRRNAHGINQLLLEGSHRPLPEGSPQARRGVRSEGRHRGDDRVGLRPTELGGGQQVRQVDGDDAAQAS